MLRFRLILLTSALLGHECAADCGQAYRNVRPCPHGSNSGAPQLQWNLTSAETCAGPCDTYSTKQWTTPEGEANHSIRARNGGTIISAKNMIPKTLDELSCWFLPSFSWGKQAAGHHAPPWNPQPEAAYLDDAGNSLGGGLPGPDAHVGCCCQEECTMEMIELRHWIYQRPGCKNAQINYNSKGNQGRVLLTRLSDRQGSLGNVKHEACMCGDKSPQKQLPFYYYVVQGPANEQKTSTLLWWLDALRTAYNNLFDIWSRHPPCSGECLIMGGASDAWMTYNKSTARSVYFQLRAFASFDPFALGDACGPKGVMLRFGGMTLDGNKPNCNSQDKWGMTGGDCFNIGHLSTDFHRIVTQEDDDNFLKEAGAPVQLTLETDSGIATVSSAEGVRVKEKKSTCTVQPTLDLPWRCNATGGINDRKACLWAPASAPHPTLFTV